MSDSPIPPIAELTISEMKRLVCADYLDQIAKMIRKGTLIGFELMWNTEIEKPIGKFVAEAGLLIGPVEAKITEDLNAYRAEQAKKISVTDLSEELKDPDQEEPEPEADPEAPSEQDTDLDFS